MIGCLFFSDNLQWLPLAYISIIILEKHVPNQGGRKQMQPQNGVTCLVVGGAQESLCGNKSTVELTLAKRTGF